VLKFGICCGVPLHVLAFLAAGGGVLLGSGAAILSVLVLLACPLGMFFMMRAMRGRGRSARDGNGGLADPGNAKER
jgi:multisubunit Na+/H+ antiporter MnhG subunit